MATMNRRTFMASTAGAVAAASLGTAISQQASAEPLTAATRCTLGNTGIECSYLGMGTGVRSWNHESELTRRGRHQFMSTLEHAYGTGLRYFDCADMYGSHAYVKEAMKDFIDRDKTMLLTKTTSRDATAAKSDLERFRKELDTDTIDIVLMHCLTAGGWTDDYKRTMDVFQEAKAAGHIRAVGCSCHNYDAMVEASTSPWVDVMLARINPFGVKMDGSPEDIVKILQTAHDGGKGVLGMKILGEGTTADRKEESLKFVTGLDCVDAIVIGFLNGSEIDDIDQTIRKVA